MKYVVDIDNTICTPTVGRNYEDAQPWHTRIDKINKLYDEGHTIVLTTHYLEEAESLCNRIGMLKHGELVMMESTDRLLQRDKECLIRLRVKKPVSTDLKSLDSVLPETTCVDPNEYLIKLFSS